MSTGQADQPTPESLWGALQERAALFEAEDAFILLLCDDHERELLALRDRTDAIARQMTDLVAKKQVAIDQTRLELRTAEEQIHDLCLRTEQLRKDLAHVQAQRDESQGVAVRLASERDQALIALSRARSGDRTLGAKLFAPSDPPAQPVARIELERWPEDSLPTSGSPLHTRSLFGQKPDPSTRPLIGYSLRSTEVAPEHLEGARIRSRRPDQ